MSWLVAAPIIGGALAGVGSYLAGQSQADATDKANEANIAHQREFAQSGLQWRVADAKKAGLHPLAALGATGASFQPAVIPSANTGVGDAMQKIGQGIGNSGVDTSLQKLQLENMQLQNEQLRSQIAGQNITNAKAFSGDVDGQATVMPHGVEEYTNNYNYVRDPVDGSLSLQPSQFDQEPTFVENHLRFFNKSFPSDYQKKQLESALIKSGELDPYSQRLVWKFSGRSLGYKPHIVSMHDPRNTNYPDSRTVFTHIKNYMRKRSFNPFDK